MTEGEHRPGTETPGVAAPPPVAADVGIVAALPQEVGFLIDRLADVRRYEGPDRTVVEGEHAGKVVAVLVGGVGRASARNATGLLLDGHRPRWIVSAGFAGALDPGLRRNDVLFPREVLDQAGRRFAVGVRAEFPDAGPGDRVTTGVLITVDAIARTAEQKAALRESSGADVVDMETAEVAACCAERGVRFLSIRVVSDEAGSTLPPEVDALMNKTGARLAGSALRLIWNRPSSLKDLLTLQAHAQEAADRLADITLAAIARLPD